MKKTNKKGFTIVELVIVIAVIAILAAVLIPTFSGVVAKAKQSSALQAARNTVTEYLATFDGEHFPTSINLVVKGADNMFFAVVNGTVKTTVYASETAAVAADGAWGAAKTATITTVTGFTASDAHPVYTVA